MNNYSNKIISVRNKTDNYKFAQSLAINNQLLIRHNQIISDPYLHLQEFPEIKKLLGAIVYNIEEVSTQYNVELDNISEHSVNSVHSIYSGNISYDYELFDNDFPEHEQIPRIMEIDISTDNQGRSVTLINGAKFGDPLRDNNYEDDGYRFHDIFHIAHAAVLGWSPTLRALLRRKRKSDYKIDDVEDGGRAIVTEEGITAMIFNHAKAHNFFKSTNSIDLDLIRIIRNTVSHLEVQTRNEYDWQKAILEGYRVWRQIRNNGSGSIIADLNARTIKLI